VNGIVSNARHSTGAVLVGIDPPKEAEISFIGGAVSKGRYLTSGDDIGIVVGEALAEQFETELERKLVVMSQDTSGEISSRAFRIAGIYQAELEATEKQFMFVSLAAAREMLGLEKGISEVSVVLPAEKDVQIVANRLGEALAGKGYEVSDWRELLPMASAVLTIYDWFIFIWFLVAFIAMGFGIVNTILMAVFERMREFGLLKALGMRPSGIIQEVLSEALFLIILGALAGNVLGFLGVYALSDTGIDLSVMSKGLEYAGMSKVIYPVILVKDVILANTVVFALGLLVSLYPAVKAARFSPVDAMAQT
jgi:ABC-type lipoprotein release transport system permease subunit